jgi:glycosyltransferase involved in cell wall biosynthesis
MKVGLHRYVTDPSLPQKDGVNLAHENITMLMAQLPREHFEVIFHDISTLIQLDMKEARRQLEDLDCIISNIGPHAHYYFWLREKCGLNFRIIRDVRTAIWSSYLLQEYLIAPLLRPTDTLLVASDYTHSIYHKFFPHLSQFITIKCYPLTISFPKVRPHRKEKPVFDEMFTIGYIGRLSEDKNFPQLIDLIISLNKQKLRRYRLVACGDVHSTSCRPDDIRDRLARELGEGDFFVYKSARPHDQIWDLLSEFDLMIFPSTSNLETFGRVLVEASFAMVPVICADHAAAYELVPSQNLCEVSYKTEQDFSAHFDHGLGKISSAEIEQKILKGNLALSECFEEFSSHSDLFTDLVGTSDEISLRNMICVPSLSPNQESIIHRITCKLPSPLSKTISLEKIGEMLNWFIALQHSDPSLKLNAVQRLVALSCFPERSERFSIKHMQTQGSFTNVGGIDIELCHVLKFYPSFTIAPR